MAKVLEQRVKSEYKRRWPMVALMSTTELGQPKLDRREKACESPSLVVLVMVPHQRKPFGENGRRRVRRLWFIARYLKGKKLLLFSHLMVPMMAL